MPSVFASGRPRIAVVALALCFQLVHVAHGESLLLEVTGERFPFFWRHGDLIDIAGVDSDNLPVIRTIDLGDANQPVIDSVSPYADLTFGATQVGFSRFSATGRFISINGFGLDETEGLSSSVFASPDYDMEMRPNSSPAQINVLTDTGGAIGTVNGSVVYWDNIANEPQVLAGDYVIGSANAIAEKYSVVVGAAGGGSIGTGRFRPVIWIDPMGENRMEVLDVGLEPTEGTSFASYISADAATIIVQRPMPNVDRFPEFIPVVLMKDSPGAPTSAADYAPISVAKPNNELLQGLVASLVDEAVNVSFYNETDTSNTFVAEHDNVVGDRIVTTSLEDWIGARTEVPEAVLQADALLNAKWVGHDRMGMTFARGDDTVYFEFQANSSVRLGDVNADGSLNADDIDAMTAMINSPYRSLYFDLDFNGVVDADDRINLITEQLNTFPGDSNLDGQFTTTDLVIAFQSGKYEDAVTGNGTWRDGDWNGDLEVDTSDLVTAFMTGAFDALAASPAAVPEPTGAALFTFAFGMLSLLRRRRKN